MMETNATYHADHSAISNSMLKAFRRSPALYRGLYIDHTIAQPEPSPQMLIGSVAHKLALEPDGFAAEYAVMPSCNGRTSEGKALKAEFALASAGKTIVNVETYARGVDIAAALRENEFTAALLNHPRRIVETPIRWQSEVSGLPLKARPDLFVPAGDGDDFALCCDIKTAADPTPEAFARQAYSLGYHCQAAYYVEGCQVAYPDAGPVRFLVLAVANDEPFDVWPYLLGQDWIGDGNEENWTALARLAKCLESGVWCDPTQLTLTTLERPAWARKRAQFHE